jgi:glutamine amidotransferase-like uncharacterized protein
MKAISIMQKIFRLLIPLVLLLPIISYALQDKNKTELEAANSGNTASKTDVVLFYIKDLCWHADLITFEKIVKELGLTTEIMDHEFINKKQSFFDKKGQRKFEVLILTAFHPSDVFGRGKSGITCQGVENILEFVKSGGSVIGLCWIGSAVFSSTVEHLTPTYEEALRGEWDKTRSMKGFFNQYCGTYAFKGIIRGPQETNRPYPTTRFLPITMNSENEIVQEADLPSVIHQVVVGGGSIIPDKDQALDVVGCYPNGTAAIGIAPYGQGRIIMSNPHPNFTGPGVEKWRRNSMIGGFARKCGWTEEMISKELKEIVFDPDGPEPDWALAKAMLSYAYKKALHQHQKDHN